MATDKQKHGEEKATLLLQALPNGTVLRSSIREYKILEALGAGGFGITYKVSANLQVDNVTLTSYFVVKEHFLKGCWRADDRTSVLHAPTTESDVRQSRKDFIEEAKRLNRIGQTTPNIVKVNEVFEANNTAYYVMEYLDGGDLTRYVDQHGPMPQKMAVGLIITVAKAVAKLHDHHLLHLDIKPDNIVMKTDPDSGQPIPILIDFGIAKHFDRHGKPTSRLVAKGASEGYAPMEQYDEIDRFAPEIDIYALGATLYFLLTGKHPPKAFNVHSFNDLWPDLPPDLSHQTLTALAAAMQPSKFDRTSNVRLLIKNLEDTPAAGPPTDTFGRKPTPRPHQRFHIRPAVKRPVLTFLAAAALSAFVLWLGLGTDPTPGPTAPRGAEDTAVAARLQKAAASQADQPAAKKSNPAETAMPQDHPGNAPESQPRKTAEAQAPGKTEASSDDLKYAEAISSGDVAVLQVLASKGYAKAYAPLAAFYLDDRQYDQADVYAQMAYAARTGRQQALSVMKRLEQLDYYVDKQLPDALKQNVSRNP